MKVLFWCGLFPILTRTSQCTEAFPHYFINTHNHPIVYAQRSTESTHKMAEESGVASPISDPSNVYRERESERSAYTPVTLYAKHHSIVAATICFPRRRFRSILCVLIDTQALHLLHEQQQQRPELNKKRNETTARKEQKKKMKRKLSKYNEANRGNGIE